jgi:predicted enzyme related to lactoylglutathione lyase
VPIQYLFAGLVVTDIVSAVEWYERLFGRPPDVLPNEQEAMWQVVEAGSVYLVEDRLRAGTSGMTVFVDDLDAELAAIAERGIPSPEINEAPGLFRATTFIDPDGNRVQIGQSLSD